MLWLALLIAGQAASLLWIDAGTRLHYQHYRLLAAALQNPWPLIVLGLQAILVSVGLRSRWRPIVTWVRANFSPWSLAGIAVAVGCTCATLSRQPMQYAEEVAIAMVVQTVSLANLVLLGWSIPAEKLPGWRERIDAWLGATGGKFPWVAAAGVTLVAAFLNVVVYERHPHLQDEVAYYMHGRFLAEGALDKPAPPVEGGFAMYLMDSRNGRWFPATPPGWPALLALGFLAGVPWLLNPILGGLNILLASWLLEALYDRGTARAGTVLMSISPWHLFLAMSFMNHIALLTAALAATAAVVQARRSGRARWAVAAGVAVGLAAMNRPLDGLVLGALLGLWAIGLGGQRLRLPCLAGFLAGGLAAGSLTLLYNAKLTGSPLRFPINAYVERYFGVGVNDLGFGANRGSVSWGMDPFPGHGLPDALVNLNLNASSLNFDLFGWTCGSIVAMAVAAFAMRWKGSNALMLATIAAICGVYSLYWFSGGPDFGARYWFLILLPCVALSARGLLLLAERLNQEAARLWVVAGVLCSLTMLHYVPWRALNKYRHYLSARADLGDPALQQRFEGGLVLIRGHNFPDYTSAAVYNPLDLRGGATVYAWDRNPEIRRQVLEAFPDRKVWIVRGPTLTKGGYEIEQGPVPASQLLPPP